MPLFSVLFVMHAMIDFFKIVVKCLPGSIAFNFVCYLIVAIVVVFVCNACNEWIFMIVVKCLPGSIAFNFVMLAWLDVFFEWYGVNNVFFVLFAMCWLICFFVFCCYLLPVCILQVLCVMLSLFGFVVSFLYLIVAWKCFFCIDCNVCIFLEYLFLFTGCLNVLVPGFAVMLAVLTLFVVFLINWFLWLLLFSFRL